ncbi:MAG: glycoside hydrolase, partial [Elusimicrobia bacterium CG02_land_8_20_14_3_00_37_13]
MNKKENPSKQEFKNPGVEYRSAPFWSLNDDLDDKELQHQLLEMKKGGMGGGFMHSRIGLITPYLSKEWMDRIKNTVAYAKKIGLLAYLYDEDRWPSGFAGGIVTKKRLNQMKLLQGKKKNGNWTFKETISPKSEWYNDSYYLNTMNRRAVGAFIKSTYDAYKNVVGKEFNKTVP